MKLSIIIPVYRVEATLDRCIESVLHQGIDDFEVILIDDGSPDNCPKMCDEWAHRDAHIRVIHQSNGGSVPHAMQASMQPRANTSHLWILTITSVPIPMPRN